MTQKMSNVSLLPAVFHNLFIASVFVFVFSEVDVEYGANTADLVLKPCKELAFSRMVPSK